MKTKHYCLAALFLLPLLSLAAENSTLRTHALLDTGWRFHFGEVSSPDQAILPAYDDTTAAWKEVQLPHDYGLDMKYDSEKGPRRRGYLSPEIAWYRKTFHIPESDSGRTLQLEFGGIFRNSKIWLNGRLVATHASGYTSFFVDITAAAKYGAENTLVIRVDPTEREGWWYEGSGIYRHVYLNTMSPLHVANYGAYIVSTVPDGDKGASREAEITIETQVQNDTPAVTSASSAPPSESEVRSPESLLASASGGVHTAPPAPATCEVLSEILAPNGEIVATLKNNLSLNAKTSATALQKTTIQNPKLWTIATLGTPNLYQLRTTITQNGAPIDTTTTTFGIRTIHFDPDKGFFLNGHPVKIYGAANHIDMPAVGIAVPDSLQPWRVKKLQEMGCNAWRTAHNPPSEALLDACDRMGMMVKAENRHLGNNYTADVQPKPGDTEFPDLTDMIRRDRNHPSIILWSLCNEEKLQGTSDGERIYQAMKTDALRFDKTRPYTCAMNGGWTNPSGFANVADLIGVNYNPGRYDAIRKAHPGKPIFGSETANVKTTRGEYKNDPKNGWVSGYNLIGSEETKDTKIGSPIATNGWPSIAARPWMAGSFTWTGFDYKGEPNPYYWPQISNNTGFMDVCGFPKDKYYYQKSCWTTAPMVHLMPMTWNWPGHENKPIRVVAFANTAQVELLLNGKSLGKKPMKKNAWVEWNVPYQPGALLAQAYSADGQLVATDKQETTGAPTTLRLSPARQTLTADNQDTIVVTLSIHDSEGRVVPNANNRVTYKLTGGGRILGTGNGNPSDHDPDRANDRDAFHGYAIVLIQSTAAPGPLTLTAASPGLTPATVTLTTK